jgi:clathrin heavy chain
MVDTNSLPINVKEVIQLQTLGIDPGLYKLNNLSFESDKYISARDNNNIIICDIEKNFQVINKPTKAEAAMMHQKHNIIAVRARNERNASIIQVWNLDTAEKKKDILINYEVIYWRWLTDTVIGMVTNTSVLALSIDNTETPAKKIFDRSGAFSNQGIFIMSLNVDASLEWYTLCGISSVKEGGRIVVNGHIQLYNAKLAHTDYLEGFCANFGKVKCLDDEAIPLLAFVHKKSTDNKYNLIITDYSSKEKKIKHSREVQMQSDTDFPVLMNFVENYGLLSLITNGGFIYIYEVSRNIPIFRCKISEDSCILSAKNSKTGGIYVINKSGKLISINVDPNNLLPFIMNYCKNVDNILELCTSLAVRYQLPGAEKILISLFKNHMQNGNYLEAAKVCRDTPGDTLRNIETINAFKSAQGTPQPILTYFQTIMEKGKMNLIESVEICKPLVMQGKKNVIETWFNSGKFTCSEELAELVKQIDPNLGLQILLQSGSPSAHSKVLEGLVATNQFDKIFAYCQQNAYKPDWITLLRNVIMVNPEAATGLAKTICNRQTNTYLIDVNTVIEIFQSRDKIQELTSFLMEYLKDNRPEDSFLQTKIIELNLLKLPKAAQVILESKYFSHYDKQKVAVLCEKIGLLQNAMDNYTDINDIKRVVLHTNLINPNYLIDYLGRMTPENCLICMHELLKHNPMQNMNIVAESAVKYSSRIPLNELVKLFETYGSYAGLFAFISRIVNNINDPEIMFKYISAGVITGNFDEVVRVVKDCDNYDPAKVLQFFLEKKLVNPKPLVILCDKHDYIEKLTNYLHKNKLHKFLENYVFYLRPQSTPRVLGTLLDEDCDENYIKQILNTVRAACPIEPLVEEFIKRHKLKVLQKFLEDREQEGNPTPALHNAIAMIYVESNNNAKDFLINNKYYDPKVVGEYCEDRDPHLALIAYKKAGGKCDEELIRLTNKNAMYRAQAQYLVESLNPDLWLKVLDSSNEHKKFVTDQVISVILPVTRISEEVSVTVKAFIDAGLQADLMDLLEKLVLHNSEFSRNKSLQNLLILTAITADPKKVKGFLTKLDSYEGPELAVKCLENSLFEEAYFIYDKVKDYSSGIDVIIRYMSDLKRATIYAEKINTGEVWSKIGKAKINNDIVDEAIEAFIRANDAEMYVEVISAAERQGKYEELIKYLQMARQFKKDKLIDGELVYSLSKCGKFAELESLLVQANISDLGNIADRLYDERIYEPARILYDHVGNNSRLASCYVNLKQYPQALAAAKKANSSRCWKEVCFACVKAGEHRLAAQAGNHIIQVADLVDELIKEYEKWGAYMELIQLFEMNTSGERNHIMTEMGILYAKYLPEKLMDHCRNYYEKMNVPKLIRACETFYHWNEVVFLHNHYNGYDNALLVMIEHSPLCFKHDLFTNTLSKVTNSNLYSEAIKFYINEQPQLLNDMLKVIAPKLDLSNTVYDLRKFNATPLALSFLKSVQVANNFDVNEALNEIYVDDEDPESLKNSILEYSSFDQINLAKKIENHHLLEFRRISALVYRKNKKYAQSIEISKNLEYFKDAIETALESESDKMVEDLLRYFAQSENKECFAACLYTCYELIKPDVAMELAWRNNFFEFLMPYMIQTVRDLTLRMDHMQRKAEDSEKQKKKEIEDEGNRPLDVGVLGGIPVNGLAVYGMPGLGGMPGMGGGVPGFNMQGGFGGAGGYGNAQGTGFKF